MSTPALLRRHRHRDIWGSTVGVYSRQTTCPSPGVRGRSSRTDLRGYSSCHGSTRRGTRGYTSRTTGREVSRDQLRPGAQDPSHGTLVSRQSIQLSLRCPVRRPTSPDVLAERVRRETTGDSLIQRGIFHLLLQVSVTSVAPDVPSTGPRPVHDGADGGVVRSVTDDSSTYVHGNPFHLQRPERRTNNSVTGRPGPKSRGHPNDPARGGVPRPRQVPCAHSRS